MRHKAILLVALFQSACSGCSGSHGKLVGASADTRFVTEVATLYVAGPAGIESVGIDGKSRRVVFGPSLYLVDVSRDYKTFLLGTPDTDLLVGDATTGTTRAVPALARRASASAFSPDGSKIAASRHADFSLPQASWKDDDAIYLIDTATLATEVIAATSGNWPAKIEWAADSSGLWVEMNFAAAPQWVQLSDKKRTTGLASAPAPLYVHPRYAKTSCSGAIVMPTRSTVIEVHDPPAAPRVVVELTGRKRGFHDYRDDFEHAAFSPGCGYIFFEHMGAVWIADAKGANVGPIGPGSWLFVAP